MRQLGRSTLLALVLVLATAMMAGVRAQTTPQFTATTAQLDAFFTAAFSAQHMNDSQIASAAVAVVLRDGTVVYQNGFGSRNIQGDRTSAQSTIFRLASVSKTLASAVACRLIDTGAIDVHADLNVYTNRLQPPVAIEDYLIGNYTSYAARPVLPTTQKLTLWNAMTQTMGLDSGGQQGTINNLNNRIPLAAYYACCAPKRIRPASDIITYSNHGIGFIGVAAEGASGRLYEELLQQEVFDKLGMTNSFVMTTPQLMQNPNLQQYLIFNKQYNLSGPYPLIGLEPVPAGDSYATAADMAKFVAMWLNQGTYAPTNTQVLSPQVVQTATTQQFSSDPTLPGLGYVWWIGEQNGVKFVEHDGNLPGFNNRVRLYMDQGVGLIMLTNSQVPGFELIARLANDFQNTFITPFPCNGTHQVYTEQLGCVSTWQAVPLAIGPQSDAATRYAYLSGEFVKYRYPRLTWLRFGGYATNRVQVGTYLGYVITSQLECWVERSDGSFYAGFPSENDCYFVTPFDSSWVRAVRRDATGRATYLMSQVSVMEQMPNGWTLSWIPILIVFVALFALDALVGMPVQLATLVRWKRNTQAEASGDLSVRLNPLYGDNSSPELYTSGGGGGRSSGEDNTESVFRLSVAHVVLRVLADALFIDNLISPLTSLSNAPGVGEGGMLAGALNAGIAAVVFLFVAAAVLVVAMIRSSRRLPIPWVILSFFVAVVQFLWIFCLAEWNWLGAYWAPQP